MSTPYLSQISSFAFGIIPKGWAACNGQLLPVNSNQALYSLLGTTYGGDGRNTFALPDLRGRVPLGFASDNVLGTPAGVENVGLTMAQLPAHNHPVVASNVSAAASLVNASAGNFPAAPSGNLYAQAANTSLDSGSSNSGASQAHANLQPYLVVQYCIALQGIYPSRS